MLQKLVMQPMRSAHALISHSRKNKDNCFWQSELSRNTILNMRSGRKVCKKWWDGFWMQTITQIPTKTLLSLFGPFTMFLEICMQIHSAVFGTSRQINKQKVCENNSSPLRRQWSFCKISSSRGFNPKPSPLASVSSQIFCLRAT